MRSTGEVMGIDLSFGRAFAKSQLAAGDRWPAEGTIFMSLADRDKATGAAAARIFRGLGFQLVATEGTAKYLMDVGIEVATVVSKVSDDDPAGGQDAVELIATGRVQLVVNSPRGRGPRADGLYIRAAAGRHHLPLLTTASAALAVAQGMAESSGRALEVRSLQEYHRGIRVGG
jgi:carbamoyl-phosphate synthase large subunit